jgi:hypothetical protein
LFAALRSLWVPEELVVATEIAAIRTREPITVMVPLDDRFHETCGYGTDELLADSSFAIG